MRRVSGVRLSQSQQSPSPASAAPSPVLLHAAPLGASAAGDAHGRRLEELTPGDLVPLLTQALLNEPVSRLDDFSRRHAELVQLCGVGRDAPDADFKTAMARVSQSLEYFGLMYREVRDEDSGERWCGLLNQHPDELSRNAAAFTPTQLGYVRLLEERLVARGGSLDTGEALQAARGDVGDIREADALLAQLTKARWLKRIDNRYALGVRSQLDLGAYLEAKYAPADDADASQEVQPLHSCDLCQEWVLRGPVCPNKKCRVKMHLHCAVEMFSAAAAAAARRRECPACKTVWPADEQLREALRA